MVEQQGDQQQMKKNRRVILGIFGIPALVFILSSLLYWLVDSGKVELGTVNHGELIVPPLPFAELPITTLTNDPFDYSKPDPKWAFVLMGDSVCEGSCEKMLYIARQSIIALAKKMNRVRLIFVSDNGQLSNTLQQRLDQEYQGVDVVIISKRDVLDLFANTGQDPFQSQTFYVVDPMGWLMMKYQIENTEQATLNTLGKAVVKDMKRLIK